MTPPVAGIESLAFGGNGVCRIDGKVCFVPFSCPGDEVSLRITSEKKTYSLAVIETFIDSSPFRTEPLCPVYGECGGCCWQHVDYQTQLAQKRKIVADALKRGAGLDSAAVEPVVAAPEQYGYRSRFQFKVSCKGDVLNIGFYRLGSHQVVDCGEGCSVASPVINRLLTRVRVLLSRFPRRNLVTQVNIDAGDHGALVVIQHAGTLSTEDRVYLTDRTVEFEECLGVFVKSGGRPGYEKLWGSPDIAYMMFSDAKEQPKSLSYAPGGFAQVNLAQNRALLAAVRRLGCFSPHDRVLDLYCGNGNFSLPLADGVATVTGVELSPDSIAAAQMNRMRNGVTNAEYICEDVRTAVKRFVKAGMTFSVVLLDPPRAGAGDVIKEIPGLKAEKIVYISCDPSTLARDCGVLTGCGYEVVTSVPVDMFPQTYHIESVTLLSRTGSNS